MDPGVHRRRKLLGSKFSKIPPKPPPPNAVLVTERFLKWLTTFSLYLKYLPHEPQQNCLKSERLRFKLMTSHITAVKNVIEHSLQTYGFTPSWRSKCTLRLHLKHRVQHRTSRPCYFCGVMETNLSRHITTVHRKEAEAAEALRQPAAVRNEKVAEFRKREMMKHNEV